MTLLLIRQLQEEKWRRQAFEDAVRKKQELRREVTLLGGVPGMAEKEAQQRMRERDPFSRPFRLPHVLADMLSSLGCQQLLTVRSPQALPLGGAGLFRRAAPGQDEGGMA